MPPGSSPCRNGLWCNFSFEKYINEAFPRPRQSSFNFCTVLFCCTLSTYFLNWFFFFFFFFSLLCLLDFNYLSDNYSSPYSDGKKNRILLNKNRCNIDTLPIRNKWGNHRCPIKLISKRRGTTLCFKFKMSRLTYLETLIFSIENEIFSVAIFVLIFRLPFWRGGGGGVKRASLTKMVGFSNMKIMWKVWLVVDRSNRLSWKLLERKCLFYIWGPPHTSWGKESKQIVTTSKIMKDLLEMKETDWQLQSFSALIFMKITF